MSDLSRRSFIKALGASFAVVALPIGWLTPDREPRRFIIAAYDSPPELKRWADIVCTGYNDQEVINSVIQRGDSVVMIGGNYYISGAIDLSKTTDSVFIDNRFHMSGQGAALRV